MNIRIKICGITHPADAVLAVEAGADLIGLNFVPDSPRRLTLEVAAAISAAVAGRTERVGVFRDATPEEIDRVLRRVDLDRLQFHGSESEAQVEEVDLPVIKAIRGADAEAAAGYPGTILLLDHPEGSAGSGRVWEWSEAAPLIESGFDVILAGGLDPETVQQAIEGVGDVLPWGVDVATGVEGAGHRKDPARLAAFVQAVRKAEAGG